MKACERFIQYVQHDTTSNELSSSVPSTASQMDFAQNLAKEMQQIGISEVQVSKEGYVYGTIKATSGRENDKVIGLIAHMDTAPASCGANIKPRTVHYDGGDIVLNKEKNVVISVKEFAGLEKYRGQDLIVTDGTTLLGADDKAGVAEIMTAAEELIAKNIPHGKIRIGFTPDEEIGRGADHFDVKNFGADYAYTVDGGELGELEYENFNAAAATVTVNGRNIHPGSAKNKMRNALLIGMEFHSMLPVFENPMYTEKREGFQHLCQMNGDETSAVMHYIIRDHDRKLFEHKKDRFKKISDYLNEKYEKDTIELSITDSYYNMGEMIAPHMEIVHRAEKAFSDCGITPLVSPIRGGTDGARLSFMGLPCPNLSTGAENMHGHYEFVSVQSMEKMTEMLIHLVSME